MLFDKTVHSIILQMKVSAIWLLLWTSWMNNLLETTRSRRWIQECNIFMNVIWPQRYCQYQHMKSWHTRLKDIITRIKWCFNQGEYNTRCTLFSLAEVLSHWVFLARFLMRQQIMLIKRYVYSFSFTRIFSHGVFLVRF